MRSHPLTLRPPLLFLFIFTALAQVDLPDPEDLDIPDIASPDLKSLAIGPLPYSFCTTDSVRCGSSGCCASDGVCCGDGCAGDNWNCVVMDDGEEKICWDGVECYDVRAEKRVEGGKTATVEVAQVTQTARGPTDGLPEDEKPRSEGGRNVIRVTALAVISGAMFLAFV